jgi:hypothetical protein
LLVRFRRIVFVDALLCTTRFEPSSVFGHMDETTRRGLLKQTDDAIRQARTELERARSELDKLQNFRTWIQQGGGLEGPPALDAADAETRTTADYIESAFVNVGPRASLTIPEILRATYEVGWTTDSANPETVIRTTVGRMGQDGRLESVPVEPNQPRRFRIANAA